MTEPTLCNVQRAYRCDDPTAVLVPVAEVRGPIIAPGGRGYTLDRLRSVMAAISDVRRLPPPGASQPRC